MIIYKYKLPINDEIDLALPEGAKILSIQTQGEDICLWALVSPEKPSENRRIRVIGTGNPIEVYGKMIHISTLQQGMFVWHIFEVVSY